MPRAPRLASTRSQKIERLPPWEKIIRGSLVRRYLTCGNKGCRCHRSKKKRHGPYWYVGVSYKRGQQKMYLIPAEQAAQAKRGVAAYHRLWKGLCRISEINLALLKAGH